MCLAGISRVLKRFYLVLVAIDIRHAMDDQLTPLQKQLIFALLESGLDRDTLLQAWGSFSNDHGIERDSQRTPAGAETCDGGAGTPPHMKTEPDEKVNETVMRTIHELSQQDVPQADQMKYYSDETYTNQLMWDSNATKIAVDKLMR